MRKHNGLISVMLVAAMALLVATVGSTASASSGTAVAAKKKCKAHKRQAGAAKKKRCKKRKNVPPVSVVRATLTWSNGGADDVDMDLFAFDGQGRRAGNGSDAIPASDLSPDVTGRSGTETFTDLNGQGHQPLSFGVCYMVGGSVHTDYTITYVTSDGVSHSETRAGDGSTGIQSLGSSAHVNYPGGAPIPTDYCPGTNLVP
jgi:hypothetical protein